MIVCVHVWNCMVLLKGWQAHQSCSYVETVSNKNLNISAKSFMPEHMCRFPIIQCFTPSCKYLCCNYIFWMFSMTTFCSKWSKYQCTNTSWYFFLFNEKELDIFMYIFKIPVSFYFSLQESSNMFSFFKRVLPFSVWSFAFCILKSVMQRWPSSNLDLYSFIWSSITLQFFSRFV